MQAPSHPVHPAHTLRNPHLPPPFSGAQTGNRGHRAVALSLMCDLLENPRAHPFFHNWRSARNAAFTGARLLLNIWSEEDAARGITEAGLLANTKDPLSGTGKRTTWVAQEAITYGSLQLPGVSAGLPSATVGALPPIAGNLREGEGRAPAISAMLATAGGEHILAKVYGCFRLLGFGSFGYLGPSEAAVLTLVEK